MYACKGEVDFTNSKQCLCLHGSCVCVCVWCREQTCLALCVCWGGAHGPWTPPSPLLLPFPSPYKVLLCCSGCSEFTTLAKQTPNSQRSVAPVCLVLVIKASATMPGVPF